MKTNLIMILAVIVFTALPARSQDQTIDGNLTVTQGLLIQQDTNLYRATTFGHLVENPQMEGFHGAPRILLSATRSDTNWVFQAPSSSDGQMRDVLTICNGGMNMNSEDGLSSFSVNPSQISQGSNQPGNHVNYYSTRGADTTSLRSNSWWPAGGSTRYAQTENISRPESIVLSRTEFGAGQPNSAAQTQIAAKSAQFGGVVTVEGDLKVKGSLRVMPAGDLSMGGYTQGALPSE